jgi:hypothetical protein
MPAEKKKPTTKAVGHLRILLPQIVETAQAWRHLPKQRPDCATLF